MLPLARDRHCGIARWPSPCSRRPCQTVRWSRLLQQATACTDEPLPPAAPDPSLPAIDPVYFSTTLAGVYGFGGWHDYTDGTDAYYGIVDMELLDAAFTTLCSITYDANLGMSLDPTDFESNDPFGTYRRRDLRCELVRLTGELSNTNCGPSTRPYGPRQILVRCSRVPRSPSALVS